MKTQEKIIDIHTHVFPEQLAARAVTSIGDFYDLSMATEAGTVEQLLAINQSCGITYSVVFSTATRLDQVEPINRFMAECQQHPALIAFGTLHPSMDACAIEQTLDTLFANDLRGIKLHPDFQQFDADAPFMHELCQILQGRLPILLHAGDPRYDHSSPHRIRRLAEQHPGTTFVAAHFGGWSCWPEAIEALGRVTNVLVDTSSSLPFMAREEILDMIAVFGIERILFGSDYPMWRPDDEIRLIRQLGLSAQEAHQIFWANSARLLGLG
jgi:hypothetical protein